MINNPNPSPNGTTTFECAELLILALAAAHVLCELQRAWQEEPLDEHNTDGYAVLEQLATTLAFVRGYFSAKQVVFDKLGNPIVPRMTLDTGTSQWVSLAARIPLEASLAVNAALRLMPGEEALDLNPVARIAIKLNALALKAGARKDLQHKDPDTGELVPVVVRAYFHDALTMQPIGKAIGYPYEED